MACVLCDVDGTLVHWGTSTPLPGAVEALQDMIRRGHQVIFTTQRSGPDDGLTAFLKLSFGTNFRIMFQVDNPRILVNDGGAFCINHPTGAPWQYDFGRFK